jgi:hypothetical protein
LPLHCATLFLLAQISAPHADTGTTWLQWSIPAQTPSCPTAAEFATKVGDHLGEPPVNLATRSHATVAAAVEQASDDPKTWRGEALLLDQGGATVGSRVISKRAESCAPISDALALVTALLLSAAQPPAALKTEPAAPEAGVRDLPPPQPAIHPAKTASPGWEASFELGPTIELGILPGLGWAAEARAFFEPRPWLALVVSAAFWPETRTTSPTGQGTTLGLWTAGIGLCPLWLRRPSRAVGFCAGADVGQLSAAGVGLATSSSQDLWFADATVAGELRQLLGAGWFAELSVRAVAPLLRTRVVYATPNGEAEVYRPWPVGVVSHLGVGYIFR